MKQHLLLDLDDTLLGNNMDVFGPAYFQALGIHLSKYVDPRKMIPALLAGTKAMTLNNNPEITLEHAFDQVFYPQIGINKSEIHAEINRFYEEVFPSLIIHTTKIPGAVELVETAFARGHEVSIATNPLFPRIAIIQRLLWTNLDPAIYPFKLIPSYETFHFAKPNPSFYTEFINCLGVSPKQCFMVGNDYEMDIIPSLQAGLKAFHFTPDLTQHHNGYHAGNLNQVLQWLEEAEGI